MKILVELISKNNIIIKRKRYKILGNRIIIEKPSKGAGNKGYLPEFNSDSILTYEVGLPFLKIIRRKVQLMQDSDKCIEFNEKPENINFNYPSKETVKKWFEAEVLKHSGKVNYKIDIPITFTLLLIMSFVLSFLTFLVTTGRIRI
jgi:hypothetical protein